MLLTNGDPFNNYAMWMFLSIGAIALFVVFIPTVTWIDSRRKEREAYYKAETIRRVTEASGEGAKAALDLMREESRMERLRRREGMKIAGVICIGVGAALSIFLFADHDSSFLIGLIPAFVGAALLTYVFLLAGPTE
jgi:hypothetical protein